MGGEGWRGDTGPAGALPRRPSHPPRGEHPRGPSQTPRCGRLPALFSAWIGEAGGGHWGGVVVVRAPWPAGRQGESVVGRGQGAGRPLTRARGAHEGGHAARRSGPAWLAAMGDVGGGRKVPPGTGGWDTLRLRIRVGWPAPLHPHGRRAYGRAWLPGRNPVYRMHSAGADEGDERGQHGTGRWRSRPLLSCFLECGRGGERKLLHSTHSHAVRRVTNPTPTPRPPTTPAGGAAGVSLLPLPIPGRARWCAAGKGARGGVWGGEGRAPADTRT